jgi:hypothetical protein
MTMTWQDAQKLLAFCAVHDRRKADKLDIDAWYDAGTLQRWNANAALRVAREYYSAGANRPRLEPPMVTDRLRELRRRAAETFELPRIPDDLPNHEYPTWMRALQAQHVDALLDHWSTTGQEPPPQRAAAAAIVNNLRDLAMQAPSHVRQAIADGARRIHNRRPLAGD